MKAAKRNLDDEKDQVRARTSKRSKLSLACERCRIKKRKCTTETPCLHCIKDGTICSKQRRKRMLKHTVPSEKSVEFYEYQIHRLSAAVSELYKRLLQSGQGGVQEDGSEWPEQPSGVHGIVDLLNLPEDDQQYSVSDSPELQDEDIDDIPVPKQEYSPVSSILSQPARSTFGANKNTNPVHLSRTSMSSAMSSLRSSQSTPVSEPTDEFSPKGDLFTEWYPWSDDAVCAGGPLEEFGVDPSTQFIGEAMYYPNPLVLAGSEWPIASTGPVY